MQRTLISDEVAEVFNAALQYNLLWIFVVRYPCIGSRKVNKNLIFHQRALASYRT